jgi:hypothetical protein
MRRRIFPSRSIKVPSLWQLAIAALILTTLLALQSSGWAREATDFITDNIRDLSHANINRRANAAYDLGNAALAQPKLRYGPVHKNDPRQTPCRG